MDKFEEKVLKKYRNHIARNIRSKYSALADKEAKKCKMYLDIDCNINEKITEIKREIYANYSEIIEEEIDCKLDTFRNSDRFKKAVENLKKIENRNLSYKKSKQYQNFPINIPKKFIDLMYEEVNKSEDMHEICSEEIHYVLLLTIYKIIDKLKEGFKIKLGTIFHIWLDKRDVRSNLPDIKSRILEDRLIPKIKLCKTFGYEVFKAINKDNQAILNYYKEKLERRLILLKIKNSGK